MRNEAHTFAVDGAVFDAIQLTPENQRLLADQIGGLSTRRGLTFLTESGARVKAVYGDFIVRTAAGTFFKLTPDEFDSLTTKEETTS